MAQNAPIQGTAADIFKIAMIRVDKVLATLPANLVLTVHDEVVFEIADSAIDDAVSLVSEAMEGAADLSVPLLVDVGIGKTWGDTK